MIIVGVLTVFECEHTLGKTLRTIAPFVDRIVVVDGAFEGFSDHIESRDGTLLKIMGFPKPYILVKNSVRFYESEMDKNNTALDPKFFTYKGEPDCDWVFKIDGDEWISKGVNETLDFLEEAKGDYYTVNTWQRHQDNSLRLRGPYMRIFRYKKGLKYVKNHWSLQYGDGLFIPLKGEATPLHIVNEGPFCNGQERQRQKIWYDKFKRRQVEDLSFRLVER